MTKRAFLLGSIFSLTIGLMLPVTEFLIQGTRLGLSSATPAAFFLLFVTLLGPQFLLKCLKPRWALSPAEILAIFSMMMVATVIPTRGFGGPFFSMVSGATYYASTENEWATLILPYLPSTIVIKEADAVRKMYEGLEGASIPWHAWVRPLCWWSFFILCMGSMVISVMFLFRRTWIERERLVFPVAQVALAMVEECPTGSRFNPLFRTSLFWIGFLLPMILESANALSQYFPEVPTFRPNWTISHNIAWVPQPVIRLNFLMFGFAFFIESQLSFSLCFFFLLSLPAYWIYGHFFPGHQETLGPWTAGGPGGTIIAHQQMGAMMVLIGTMVWAARGHLLKERLTGSAFLISTTLMCLLVWGTGVPYWIAPLVVGSALVIWLSLTRLMVQAGIATIVPAIVPLGFIVSTIGVPSLGTVGLLAMGLTLIWSGDLLTYLMGPAANSIYVGHRAKISPITGSWSLLAAVMLSLGGCFFMTLYLTGKVGGLNLHPQYFQNFPLQPWRFAESKLHNATDASLTGYMWTGVGAGLMLLLTYGQRVFFWWPLHPLGFLAQGGWIMRQLWFSFLLAWLVKTAVLRYGGGGGYKKARVFFIGIIVGLLVVGGLWLIIDSTTGMRGNRIRIY
ncbi:MAG: hypothetical protein QGI86_04585 [Candidatus Poribacteria bacterium]|jgi:hypothetical protein|nr:hypothetical protein [Candidatus Poribacteria bacterium]MDP6750874.1 hypothetical protein [Candidatus Poribacteria bacterium]MDP6994742.1 hypothetical protein [Candidatus Poribacteria bacterium]